MLLIVGVVVVLGFLEFKHNWFAKLLNWRPKSTPEAIPKRFTSTESHHSRITVGTFHTKHGKTYYQRTVLGPIQKPNSEKKIKRFIFVHGISVGSVMFAASLKKLEEYFGEKYMNDPRAKDEKEVQLDILTIDLYGRGYSDSPLDVRYDANLFVEQIYQVAQACWRKEDDEEDASEQSGSKKRKGLRRFGLVGVSMGGAIISAFTEKYPDLVSGLVYVAPAGLYVPFPVEAVLSRIPFFSDLFISLLGPQILKKNFNKGLNRPERYHRELQFIYDYYDEMKVVNPQSFLAIGLTVKQFDFSNQFHAFEAVGKTHRARLQAKSQEGEEGGGDGESKGLPVLCFWGKKDDVVPYVGSERLLQAIPQAQLVTVPDAKHAIWTEFVIRNLDTEIYFEELFNFLID